MFESCRPDSRKLLGNKGLSAFLGQGAGRAEKRWGNSGAIPGNRSFRASTATRPLGYNVRPTRGACPSPT
jgi:hypothetical protein